MSIQTEDGSGMSDSESFVSVADADTYLAARGFTLWATMSEAEKEQALRRATDYMGAEYRLRWKGVRGSATQALDWPRSMVERPDYAYAGVNGFTTIGGNYYFPSNEVPVEVQSACAVLAYKAASGDLAADIGRVTTRERVDVIEVEYAAGQVPFVRYRAVDLMLAPFLRGRAGSVMVVRT